MNLLFWIPIVKFELMKEIFWSMITSVLMQNLIVYIILLMFLKILKGWHIISVTLGPKHQVFEASFQNLVLVPWRNFKLNVHGRYFKSHLFIYPCLTIVVPSWHLRQLWVIDSRVQTKNYYSYWFHALCIPNSGPPNITRTYLRPI